MKTFAQFRNEIGGYEDVRKTAEAEEKIAITNVHLFLEEARELKNYTESLERMLNRFLSSAEMELKLTGPAGGKKALFVFGGDKGMVGGLWNRLVDFLSVHLENYQEATIYGQDVAKKLDLVVSRDLRSKIHFSFFIFPAKENIFLFQNNLLKSFQEKGFSQIDVIWPKMITSSFFQPTKKTIIPFNLKNNFQVSKSEHNLTWPIFEPNAKKVFKTLAEKYLFLIVHQIIIETKLAEALNRAVSMEKAKKEVGKLIKKITHNFRTERRKILTKNQIEVFIAHKISKVV